MNYGMEPSTPGHRSRITASLVSLLATLLVAPGILSQASAQESITVSGEVTCPECLITLDTVVTIAGPDLEISIFPGIAVDRRGRYLLTDASPRILVFDSTGAFLRTVGRQGEGPGEYQFLTHMNVGPRYIHAFDNERGRTVLDHDFEVVRTNRFAANYLHSHMTDSEVAIFAGDVMAQGATGYALHFLELSGEMTSYDGDGRGGGFSGAGRNIVTGDSASLWVVEPSPNRLTRWSLLPEPRKDVVFVRTVEEFDRHTDPSLHPRPINSGALLVEEGLWLLWTGPDPDFTRTRGGTLMERPSTVRDTWLDLVDPETGSTLARLHSDGSAVDFAHGSRYFYFYDETEAGEPFVVVVEPRLTRGPPARR